MSAPRPPRPRSGTAVAADQKADCWRARDRRHRSPRRSAIGGPAHGFAEQDDEAAGARTISSARSGLFDGVIDFDKVTVNRETGELQPEFVPDSTAGGERATSCTPTGPATSPWGRPSTSTSSAPRRRRQKLCAAPPRRPSGTARSSIAWGLSVRRHKNAYRCGQDSG